MKYDIKVYTSLNPDLSFTFDASEYPALSIHHPKTLAYAILDELPEGCDAETDFRMFAGRGSGERREDLERASEPNTQCFMYTSVAYDEDSLEDDLINYLVTVTAQGN